MGDNDKNVILASEQVQRRNIEAIRDYSTDTRKGLREIEVQIKELKNLVHMQNNEIGDLRKQISLLQAKLYSGGPTG